jgi:outer membrane lipoprotein-sorting protein
MEISLKQTIVANKAQRTDISVMGMSGFSIVTQNAGYKYMPFMGATKIDTMKADEIKMNQNQLNPKTVQMLDYAANGTKVELAGKDTINNQACYKIKCTNKEGENSFCYIDMNNYYLIRIEKNARIQGEDQEVAVVFNNYTKLPEGVVMPMSMTAQGVEITYKSIELNKPVDDKIFVPTIEK